MDLGEVRQYLLNKQQEIQQRVIGMTQEDPVFLDAIAQSSELGTSSWESDTHERISVLKTHLLNMSHLINKVLEKIKKGTYSSCDKCGQAISFERLKAMPLALHCQDCI